MTKFQQLYNTSVSEWFSKSWKNKTGYFDGAVEGPYAICLTLNQQSRFIDDLGRKGVFVGTPFGTALFFERYRAGEGGIIVKNFPRNLEANLPEGLDMSGQITDEKLIAFMDWLETLKA